MIGSRQTEGIVDAAQLRRAIAARRILVAQRDPERLLEELLAHARELTGARSAEVLAPDAPVDEGSLDVPIVIGVAPWRVLRLAGQGEREFGAADREIVSMLAEWAGIALANARRPRDTDERRVELERSILELEATSEVARLTGGETRLDRVLELIADRSRSLVEASGVLILLSEGEELSIAATAGNVPRDLTGLRMAARHSAAGRVLASGQPKRLNRLEASPDLLLARHGVRPRSAVIVPLMVRGVRLGVIEAFDRIGGPQFRIEDERLLLAAAVSAAGAVATAQSVERERLRESLAAAEQERSRWARELHDDTLQALGGLRVLLSSARRREDVPSLHSALDGAVERLQQEIANLRALITELRPAALDQLGLAPALEALFERIRDAHGLRITSSVALGEAGARRLGPEIETVVYRVVQESLTNAVRHARSDRVEVEVLDRGDEIQLAIRDHGRGFDVNAPSGGFGLSGIRERIALAGGRLEISSSASGTKIEAL
ncbi:MAG TPA: GAF domain-containing sensor histidine kinase, partial [Solirubrobacteraceae bacterium]